MNKIEIILKINFFKKMHKTYLKNFKKFEKRIVFSGKPN